jgi:uncharacterized protein YrrD
MQFKDGATVYTANGQNVGSIDRVVIDPGTDEVTHVVVRQGMLFTEDKVVPTEIIDTATAEEVRLRADVDNLEELPHFEETHYLSLDETDRTTYPAGYARPAYWYPPVGLGLGYYPSYYAYPARPYVVETERNIPEGAVGLKEGAKVVSADGETVGNVARVFTDDEMQQATHLLITEGWIFKEKKVVPIGWVKSMAEDEIRLTVNARRLERVPVYQR